LDFFIHPLAVVLLVINNAQSSCLSLSLMMLIQGVIIVARNLEVFWDLEPPCVPLVAVDAESGGA
jgi:hypothetical protein